MRREIKSIDLEKGDKVYDSQKPSENDILFEVVSTNKTDIKMKVLEGDSKSYVAEKNGMIHFWRNSTKLWYK